jgi:hypothetical protein
MDVGCNAAAEYYSDVQVRAFCPRETMIMAELQTGTVSQAHYGTLEVLVSKSSSLLRLRLS